MRKPLSRDSILSVIESGLPLAVQCGYCPRRVLIRRERLVYMEASYRISALPLVCACGSRDVAAFILETPDEAETFIEPNASPGITQPGPWRPTF